MTDKERAIREAGHAQLAGLEASTAELTAHLASLLSPAVVSALRSPSGTASLPIDSASIDDASARATAILRDLDSRLPALRVTAVAPGSAV